MTVSGLGLFCRQSRRRPARGAAQVLLLAGLLLALVGCASGPQATPHDPLEPFNRGVFRLNDNLDSVLVKPVATLYRDRTPTRVRQGIGNVFGNLEDVWSAVNSALQLNGRALTDNVTRVVFNSLIGIGGVFDVASEMDIERHTKDFGHTLGFWGVPPGPYIMLPILGPSTLRDTVALPLDWQGDLVRRIPYVPARNAATVLRGIDTRSSLLKATSMLEEVALDRYTFTRDAFLQRRRNDIFGGYPPEEDAPTQPEVPDKKVSP
jgi:phospholipid-binding lipoprotein MlaA